MKRTNLMAVAMLSMVGTASAAAPVAAQVDLQKSTIKWEASKVSGKHHGLVSLSQANVQVEKNVLKGGTFVVDLKTINDQDMTGSSKETLEKHLKSPDFFNVDSFPTSKFVITSVTLKSGSTYTVTGNLTIKDKTNPITFDAAVSVAGNTLKATANQVKINRTKWGLIYGSASFFKGLADKAIKDEIIFDIVIEASLK